MQLQQRRRLPFPLRTSLDAVAALAAAVENVGRGILSPLSGAPQDPTVRSAKPERRLRKSLKTAVAEGMTAEIVSACSGGAVLTAWALALGGGPLLVGLLGSLPYVSQLVQMPSAWLTSRVGGRKVALWAVAISRQALWPLVFLPFLACSTDTKSAILFVVAAISALLSIVGNNGWVSWMGDLVPRAIRGRYFGRRTAVCTLAGAVANLGAGLLIDWAKRQGNQELALSLLGLTAVSFGALSTVLMARQHDPGHVPSTGVPWRAALAPLRDPRAVRFLMFLVPWNLGIGVSSVFFNVFMLQDLGMGFALMALQGIGTALVRMLAAPLWGKAIDRVGARPVLVACSFLIVGIPLLWLFPTREFIWWVFLDSLCSGILWSGHNLATFQMPLALAPREGRSFHLAAFSAAGGIAFAIAGIFGGFIARELPPTVVVAGHPLAHLQVLFVLSAIIRLGAAFLSIRTSEPGSRPVRELGRLVTSAAPDLPVFRALRPAEEPVRRAG